MSALKFQPSSRICGSPAGFGLSQSAHRHEQQIRRSANPHAAETDFESADQVDVFQEDGALVELVVAVGVFEHQDAIRAAEDVFELGRGWFGSRSAAPLCSAAECRGGLDRSCPRPPTRVRDGRGRRRWAGPVRLGGEDVHFEIRRQRGLGTGFLRGKAGIRDHVRSRGRVRTKDCWTSR